MRLQPRVEVIHTKSSQNLSPFLPSSAPPCTWERLTAPTLLRVRTAAYLSAALGELQNSCRTARWKNQQRKMFRQSSTDKCSYLQQELQQRGSCKHKTTRSMLKQQLGIHQLLPHCLLCHTFLITARSYPPPSVPTVLLSFKG